MKSAHSHFRSGIILKASCEARSNLVSELCHPRNPGQAPWFTGALRCTALLREVVERWCVGACRCALLSAAGINFQACSFNHSDISPFRINHLRAVRNSVAQNPPSNPARPDPSADLHFTRTRYRLSPRIVSDLSMSLDHLRRFCSEARCRSVQVAPRAGGGDSGKLQEEAGERLAPCLEDAHQGAALKVRCRAILLRCTPARRH